MSKIGTLHNFRAQNDAFKSPKPKDIQFTMMVDKENILSSFLENVLHY